MKLLWFGDVSATGFGTVTIDTGRELVKVGADVRFVSQNYLPDDLEEPFLSRTLSTPSLLTNEEGVTGVAVSLADVVQGKVGHLKLTNGESWGDWTPEACIVLGDFYALRIFLTRADPELKAFSSIPTFHYVPIEGHDLPPRWKAVWGVIKPIAMTEFGRNQLQAILGYRPPMVYHGVDAETFHPVSAGNPLTVATEKPTTLTSKAACKAFFGLDPRMTMLLRTDRNMPRKGYPALLRAMTPVLAERPNVVLALHCQSWDQGGDLFDSISKLPPNVQGRVLVPDWGPMPRDALVALYNAADLYVSTSAEGFGLTIAEAIACGVPAVALDYSAVPEVVGPAGVLTPVGRVLDNEYAHHWALPDEQAFGKRVAYLLDHPHKRLAMGAMGPGHIRKNFRWDVAAERFLRIASVGHSEPRRAAISDERVMVAA